MTASELKAKVKDTREFRRMFPADTATPLGDFLATTAAGILQATKGNARKILLIMTFISRVILEMTSEGGGETDES